MVLPNLFVKSNLFSINFINKLFLFQKMLFIFLGEVTGFQCLAADACDVLSCFFLQSILPENIEFEIHQCSFGCCNESLCDVLGEPTYF